MFFFFNDTATTEIYTLSLHDALPISVMFNRPGDQWQIGYVILKGSYAQLKADGVAALREGVARLRSEEHTSELQSRSDLVCRLLLEKKKINLNTDLSLAESHVVDHYA